MRLNKKGQEMETQQAILYVLFSMVVLIFGVIMIQQFAESINVQTTFYTQNLEYKLLSARILNSANCLAWEQPISSKTIVRAGIIDGQKFNPERIKQCINSDNFYIVALDTDGALLGRYGKL